MSTDEYVPSGAKVRHAYVVFESRSDVLAARAEFDRFLARVRRDAAREALNGLARQEDEHCEEQRLDMRGYHIHFLIADAARTYRDTHYPEETP